MTCADGARARENTHRLPEPVAACVVGAVSWSTESPPTPGDDTMAQPSREEEEQEADEGADRVAQPSREEEEQEADEGADRVAQPSREEEEQEADVGADRLLGLDPPGVAGVFASVGFAVGSIVVVCAVLVRARLQGGSRLRSFVRHDGPDSGVSIEMRSNAAAEPEPTVAYS